MSERDIWFQNFPHRQNFFPPKVASLTWQSQFKTRADIFALFLLRFLIPKRDPKHGRISACDKKKF
jgi:hypothetical protein